MRYFIIGASKDHVEIGVAGSFAQAGHGKRNNLNKMAPGDWVIYYSSKDRLNGNPYQKFTAIGQVRDEEAYQVKMNENFHPWRRDVQYYPAREVAIRPLIDKLDFIKNKKKWGFYLMSGFVEIGKEDFERIAGEMLEGEAYSDFDHQS